LHHHAKLRQHSKAKLAVQEGNRILFRRILHMLHNNIHYENSKRERLYNEKVWITFTHSLTHSLTRSLTNSLTHLLARSLTHSLTYLLTHLLVYQEEWLSIFQTMYWQQFMYYMTTHLNISHKLHKIMCYLEDNKLHNAWHVLQAHATQRHRLRGIQHHVDTSLLSDALHVWRAHFLRFHNMPKLSLQSPYIKLAVDALRRSYRTNIRVGVYSSRRKLRHGKSKLSLLSPKRKTTSSSTSAVYADHFIYGMPVEVILRLIQRNIKLSLYRYVTPTRARSLAHSLLLTHLRTYALTHLLTYSLTSLVTSASRLS
jgi:predicted DNA-binding protein (UPF0278 family)